MINRDIVRAAIEQGPIPCTVNPFEWCPCGSGKVATQCCYWPPPWGADFWFGGRVKTGRQKPTTLVMEHVIEAGGLANWDGLIESTKFSNKRLGDTLRQLFADGLLVEVSRGTYSVAGEGVIVEVEHTMAPTLDTWFMRRQA